MFKIIVVYLVISIPFVNLYLSSAFSQDATNLEYMTEQNPPFNYKKNGKLKGIAVDLLKAIWEEMGVPEQEIQLLPWERAYKLAQVKENSVLFSTTRSVERENMFEWVGPIKTDIIGFIARKERNIKLYSPEDARKYKLATLRNDYSEVVLKNKGFDLNMVERTSDLNINILKLRNGRIDIVVNSVLKIFMEMEKKGIDTSDFETVGKLTDADLYFAFNKNIPQELIDKFQNAITALNSKR
ncbi:MAG: ABC transporter substrate-binding protein, partial [Chitinispirillia bacterium]